ISSNITVAGGATLDGSGVINGNVVLLNGAFLVTNHGLQINGTVVVATTTTVSAFPLTVTYGATQTFTATVFRSGGAFVTSGSVTFLDTTAGTVLASNLILNGSGQASVTVTLSAGNHVVQANYNPDAAHLSSSGVAAASVNKATLTVTADPK